MEFMTSNGEEFSSLIYMLTNATYIVLINTLKREKNNNDKELILGLFY